MRFRLELRDKDFNVLEILDKEYLDLSWAYSRIGGCGEINFRLPRKLFEEKSISGDFNLRIYYRNPSTNNFDLWYQGLIENKTPSIRGNSEDIEISGHGYQAQLSRIYINTSYSNTEASAIITSLLNTYITPNTNISFSASDIENTSFTVDTIEFNTDALTAIRTIADIVGSREWGVDENRKFFFKARSTTVGHILYLNKNVISYSENLDFKEIINRIVVQGGQTGGTHFTAIYNDLVSQAKYNLRTKVIQNSSIFSTTVAMRYATSVFAEFNDVVRRASCEMVNFDIQIESTNPINLLTLIGKEIKYGEKRYGEFLYSGLVNRTVNRINYSISNNNSLKISLDLGQLRPSISEELSQLEYQLEQQRSAAL